MKCYACGTEIIDITAHIFECKVTKAKVKAQLGTESAKRRAAWRKLKPQLVAKKSRAPIKFQLENSDRGTYALVTVDIPTLDRAWRLTDSYISPHDQADIDERFVRLAAWIAGRPDQPIPAPRVLLTEGRDLPSFDDGRRRFALSRDLGYRTIKVAVPREQIGLFRKVFGPNVSKTIQKPKRATGRGKRSV